MSNIPQAVKNKIEEEAAWRSTNGHGGVDQITRDNFIIAAEYGYSISQSQEAVAEKPASREVEEMANAYATQMMGIGEYSEKWTHPDKYMFNTLVKSYKAGYAASQTQPVDEGEQEGKAEYDNCRAILKKIVDESKAHTVEAPFNLIELYKQAEKFLEKYQH